MREGITVKRSDCASWIILSQASGAPARDTFLKRKPVWLRLHLFCANQDIVMWSHFVNQGKNELEAGSSCFFWLHMKLFWRALRKALVLFKKKKEFTGMRDFGGLKKLLPKFRQPTSKSATARNGPPQRSISPHDNKVRCLPVFLSLFLSFYPCNEFILSRLHKFGSFICIQRLKNVWFNKFSNQIGIDIRHVIS